MSPTAAASRVRTATRVTDMLLAWGQGDQDALSQIVPLVHLELRRLARRQMRRERDGHTLQTTALVNELYVRLIDVTRVRWQDRAHFFAMSSRIMRRVLVDHARSRRFQKRGGQAIRVSIHEAHGLSREQPAEIEALDDALNALAVLDPRKSQVVELRFFGGLSVAEAAETLGVSQETVMRDWRLARAWLFNELNRVN